MPCIKAECLTRVVRTAALGALVGIVVLAGCGPAPAGSSLPAAGGTPPAQPVAQEGAALAGKALVESKKCTAICHKPKNSIGAPLLEDSLPARRAKLASYDQHVARLKIEDPARYEAARTKIDAVLAEQDAAKRLKLWLSAYLAKTTFDDGRNKMLDVVPKLSTAEIEQLSAYLSTLE